MVLSHANTGKYLSKRFDERRNEYYDHPEGVSDNEKTWLESSTITNAGNAEEENWLVETTPMEWPEASGPILVDIRKIDINKYDGRE